MRRMNRRSLLALPFVFAPLAIPGLAQPALAQPIGVQLSPQDRADVARIETYLNATRSLTARFLQVAPDGNTTQGQAWLVRPGRMRFQYDPPTPFLLVGGNGLLVFHDSQLQQTSNIPLGSTPLGLLLQDNLRLSGDITIVSFVRQPGQIQVGVVRTKSPQDGVLTLIFSDNPLSLRQWTVLDAQRNETRVTLSNVQIGGTYPSKLFEFIDPRFFENNSGG
jgi:outer membrane lipoprotein-sorting protein